MFFQASFCTHCCRLTSCPLYTSSITPRCCGCHLCRSKIFSAYVKGHSVLPTKYEQGGGDDNSNNDNCNTNHNNSNTVWCQGRPVTLKLFLSQGPYLAWSGFEALCNDFKVAKTTSRTTSSRLIGAAAQENHPDHSRPFETPTQPDREQNAIAAAAAESFLLTEVEARVAFLCACTHKSVVASFPDTDGKAVVAAAAGAGVEGVADNRTNHGNEERYWKVDCRIISQSTLVVVEALHLTTHGPFHASFA